METFLQYIVQYVPTIIAILSECVVVKWALKVLKEAKEIKDFKKLSSQNEALLKELKDAKKLNKELLTKIDRIERKNDE
jgi:F420-0:gamma-glutamyl ligase-like protein